MTDSDAMTRAEARAALGVTEHRLGMLIEAGRVTLADRPLRRYSRREIEALAADLAEEITTAEAAAILGVNQARVGQLVAAGLLPCERIGRRRIYRRTQVQVIANARRVRWHGSNLPPPDEDNRAASQPICPVPPG